MSETHTLLSAALGKLHCGVLIIDSQRRICFINQWLLQALRHPALDYQDRPLLDVLPEIADSRLYKSIGQALDKGLPAVLSPSLNPYPLPLFNGRADDPERLPMIQSLQVMPLRQQGLNHCMIAVSDLSSTMRRENLLKVQAEKLSQQSLTDDLTSSANRRRLNQVLDEGLTGVLAGACAGLQDDRCTHFVSRLHDGLHLLQVVDVEGWNAVAVDGCVVQQFAH